jgi:hypothetical protein
LGKRQVKTNVLQEKPMTMQAPNFGFSSSPSPAKNHIIRLTKISSSPVLCKHLTPQEQLAKSKRKHFTRILMRYAALCYE